MRSRSGLWMLAGFAVGALGYLLWARRRRPRRPRGPTWEDLNAEGTRAFGAGELPAAEQRFRQALRKAQEDQAGLQAVAACRNNLGAVLRARGALAEAEGELREALRLREELAGPESPRVAQTLSNLADVLARLGRHAEAEEGFRRAISIRRQKLDGARREVTYLLGHLGDLLEREGRHAEAGDVWQQALALDIARLGEEALELASWYDRLTRAARRRGDRTQALAHARRSLEVRERHLPSLHTDRATGMVQLALTLDESGEGEGARDLLAAAADVLEGQLELLGDRDPEARRVIEKRLGAVRARLAGKPGAAPPDLGAGGEGEGPPSDPPRWPPPGDEAS